MTPRLTLSQEIGVVTTREEAIALGLIVPATPHSWGGPTPGPAWRDEPTLRLHPDEERGQRR